MFDFIKLFFASLAASFRGLQHPSPIMGIRRLQFAIVGCFLGGTLSFASSIYLLLKSNGATATWFWMMIAGGGLWTISACLGELVSKITEDDVPA